MLQRLSIRYKIGLIALIGLLGFAIFQTASYRLSVDIRDQLKSIKSDDFALLKFAHEIQVDFSNVDKLYQASLAEADTDTLLEADDTATRIKLRFKSMKNSMPKEDALFNELQLTFTDYVNRTSLHTAAVLGNSLDYERTLAGYSEIGLLRERYEKVQTQLLEERYQAFEKQLIIIEDAEAYLVRFGLVLGAILASLLLMVSFYIIRNLTTGFNKAVKVAEQIANGNLDQSIDTDAQDEMGQLMHSLQSMQDVLKAQHEESQVRNEVQSFLGGLHKTMRGDQSLQQLTTKILEYLALHYQAQLGSFFLLNHDNTLTRVASYAYPRDQLNTTVALGETMIGQTALEQRAKIITSIPYDFVKIATGIGQAVPTSIMLFPVVFENRLQGVIELASFTHFTDNDLSLLDDCNDAMATAIASAQSRFAMARMLELEKQQASELESQRQALSTTNEALADRSEELDKQNSQLEQSQADLMHKSEALELSGRYKSQFLSTMSHELRTPLNSILILSEALIENRNNGLNEKEVRHAKVINTAGVDLLTLINDILDLSKVEEGKMELVIDEIKVKDFSDNLFQIFEYITKDKGLAYSVKIDKNLPDQFYTDKHRLTQIVKNFISNALKFTETGFIKVFISRPCKPFLPTRSGLTVENSMMLTVKDSGTGIPKDKQKMVFEAFKQVDGTTSRKYGGTGLGLTISMELASLLGGEILLKSEEGCGSEFTLIIPLGSPKQVSHGRYIDSVADFSPRETIHLPKNAVLDDMLFISAAEGLQDRLQACMPVLRELSCVSVNKRNSLADVDKLNANIHCKLFVIDGDGLLESQWCFLRDYLQEGSAKYGVLVIIAESKFQSRIENLGALYFERKSILQNKEQALSAFSSMCALTNYTTRKVLIVEDNPVFNEVIKALFNKNKVPMLIAKNGAQALNLLSYPAFSSLIVDLNLPDYSDVLLLTRIRSIVSYQRTHITVFTAEDLEGDRLDNIYKYANQVVVKSPKSIIDLCLQAGQILHQQHIADSLLISKNTESELVYSPGDLQGVHVLLVDDDERNLYSLTQALEAEGLCVTASSSGEQALSMIKQDKQLQIVLLDIMMPDMDGYQVLEQLRASHDLQKLPVIALTAKAMQGDKEQCLSAGASDYLSKPIAVSVLLNCICRHLLIEPTN